MNSQIPDVIFLQIEREFLHEVGRAEELASEFVHIAGIYAPIVSSYQHSFFLSDVNVVYFYPILTSKMNMQRLLICQMGLR